MLASATPRSPRLVALDGLRALAALVVLFGHASYAIDTSSWPEFKLLHVLLVFLLNTSGAVHVFFVISGYCLTASALRGSRPADLAQFYLRRVARIHGPYVFAASLAWLASIWLYPDPAVGLSPWMRDQLGVRIAAGELARALRFPGLVGGLLPQGWTLAVEMLFSLLMPFMALLGSLTHWAVLVAASACVLAVSELPFEPLGYGFDFALGIAIFLERDRLGATFARLPRSVAPGLGLAGLLMLTLPAFFVLGRTPPLASFCISGGAASIVIAAVHAPPLQRFLAWRPVAELGRVSYSIFLLHFSVLALCTPLIGDGVGPVGGVAFVLLVTLSSCALAPISYLAVERPCIRAGGAACRWLSRLTGATPREAGGS